MAGSDSASGKERRRHERAELKIPVDYSSVDAFFAEFSQNINEGGMFIEMDRPVALRDAILTCANGGVVSVIGVYTGFIDKFPMGSLMNRSLTIRTGQCHVQRYMRPLLERIERGDIDPTFIITHHLPLERAAEGYEIFNKKQDHCEKVVLRA